MNYTDNVLQQIERMASLYLSVTDMATVLGVPAELLRTDINIKGSPAALAYNRGKVATKVELRKQEIMLAKVGSPVALDNCHRALLDMEDDE